MNIIYFGNGQRGVRCLEILLKGKYNISAIVGHVGDSDVVRLGKKHRIPTLQPRKINENNFVGKLREYSPDLFVLAGYKQILKKDLINVPKFGSFNLHGGKLPEYRGVAPINWQIINGETTGGCCIILLDEGIDTGDIVEQVNHSISENDTAGDVINKQLEIFPPMLIRSIENIRRNKLTRVKQDLSVGAYYTRRYPEDGKINWHNLNAKQVHNLIRALNGPYPPAFCNYNGERYNILSSRLLDEKIMGLSGRIALRNKNGTVVIAKDKGLLITDISRQDGTKCSHKIFKLGDDLE